ncbi:hypothetical protein HK096_011461, partial [Nowakowskiella sp. JEL0078]
MERDDGLVQCKSLSETNHLKSVLIPAPFLEKMCYVDDCVFEVNAGKEVAICLEEFVKREPNQLSVEKGSLIVILEKKDDWILVEKVQGSEKGLIPSNNTIKFSLSIQNSKKMSVLIDIENSTFEEDKEKFSGDIVTAKVTRWELKERKYYFVIEVQSLTINRIIFRTYDQFYEFQVSILNSFPIFAGKEKG